MNFLVRFGGRRRLPADGNEVLGIEVEELLQIGDVFGAELDGAIRARGKQRGCARACAHDRLPVLRYSPSLPTTPEPMPNNSNGSRIGASDTQQGAIAELVERIP